MESIENPKRHRAFDQIMRDENQEIMQKLLRKKRQINDIDDDDDDMINNDDDQTPDAIPILVFSTQAPQEVSRLQVTDDGELILLDVTERDQVRNKVILMWIVFVTDTLTEILNFAFIPIAFFCWKQIRSNGSKM